MGFLFLHTRYESGRRFLHWMTSPDGREWSEPHRLARAAMGHYQISWRHGQTVGTAFNVHPEPVGLNARTNLYYIQTDDGGRLVAAPPTASPAELPVTAFDHPALVHDYETEGLLVYLKDLQFDEQGRPVILYLTSKGYDSGPANGPRNGRRRGGTARGGSSGRSRPRITTTTSARSTSNPTAPGG